MCSSRCRPTWSWLEDAESEAGKPPPLRAKSREVRLLYEAAACSAAASYCASAPARRQHQQIVEFCRTKPSNGAAFAAVELTSTDLAAARAPATLFVRHHPGVDVVCGLLKS